MLLRRLLMLIVISGFTPVVSAAPRAKANQQTPFTGFWHAISYCFSDTPGAPYSDCYEELEPEDIYELDAKGAIYTLTGETVCEYQSPKFICEEEMTGTFDGQNHDGLILTSASVRIRFERISAEEFFGRRRLVEEKIREARAVLQSLYGRTLTLDRRVNEVFYPINGKTEVTETPAGEINDKIEYTDGDGAVLVAYNPKQLIFHDDENVTVNDELQTHHALEWVDEKVDLLLSLALTDGELDMDDPESMGQMTVEGSTVHIRRTSDNGMCGVVDDGSITECVFTTDYVYNIDSANP